MIDHSHPRPKLRDREVVLCKAIMHGTIDEIHEAVSAYISIRDFYEARGVAANRLSEAADIFVCSAVGNSTEGKRLKQALETYRKTIDTQSGRHT